MSDHGHHSHPVEDVTENDADQREDARAALIVFIALLAMAVHFVSGWTF